MNVTIKTPDEQDKMRVAGKLAADVLDMIGEHVQPGVTTDELDRICHEYITGVQDATPAPLNYRGFPKSICTSVNHVVCHGIPGERKLKSGESRNSSSPSALRSMTLPSSASTSERLITWIVGSAKNRLP